jgi:hypothetical protein
MLVIVSQISPNVLVMIEVLGQDRALEPIDDPFGPRLLPISPE